MEIYIDRGKAIKKLAQLETTNPNFTMGDVKVTIMGVPLADVVPINKYKEVCEQLDFMKSRCKKLEGCLMKDSFGYPEYNYE